MMIPDAALRAQEMKCSGHVTTFAKWKKTMHVRYIIEDSVVCFPDTAWGTGGGGERYKERQIHEGCHQVNLLAHSGSVVWELAEVDYLLVRGGNDVSKPAISV